MVLTVYRRAEWALGPCDLKTGIRECASLFPIILFCLARAPVAPRLVKEGRNCFWCILSRLKDEAYFETHLSAYLGAFRNFWQSGKAKWILVSCPDLLCHDFWLWSQSDEICFASSHIGGLDLLWLSPNPEAAHEGNGNPCGLLWNPCSPFWCTITLSLVLSLWASMVKILIFDLLSRNNASCWLSIFCILFQ